MTRSLPLRPSARSRFRAAPVDTSPIATINTTPMIDMMLVLLILFIVSIPIRTHWVPLDLPQAGPPRPDLRPVHRLDIDAAGRTRWDGVVVDGIALRRALAGFARDPARPDLHLNADGEARYERVDQILADIRRAGVTRLGLVNHRRFDHAIG
jgi:biopolymer transport protein ExbD